MRIAQTLFEKGTKALPFQEKVNTLHSAFSASLANALPEVKEQVTAVLDDCDHDGVAKFLEKEWELS